MSPTVAAAETTLPVIGVPIDSSPLSGFDALLSTVQMPPGVPVGTMGVGKSGATNAGFFAVQILAVSDEKLAKRLASLSIRILLTLISFISGTVSSFVLNTSKLSLVTA